MEVYGDRLSEELRGELHRIREEGEAAREALQERIERLSREAERRHHEVESGLEDHLSEVRRLRRRYGALLNSKDEGWKEEEVNTQHTLTTRTCNIH